jgi:CheY-like chemotaxis protein
MGSRPVRVIAAAEGERGKKGPTAHVVQPTPADTRRVDQLAEGRCMARILIIDFDEAAIHRLTQILRTLDHEVLDVRDTDSLPDALAADPEVLIIDVTNPGVDAFALVRELRQRTPHLRVCTHAGSASKVTGQRSAEAHCALA